MKLPRGLFRTRCTITPFAQVDQTTGAGIPLPSFATRCIWVDSVKNTLKSETLETSYAARAVIEGGYLAETQRLYGGLFAVHLPCGLTHTYRIGNIKTGRLPNGKVHHTLLELMSCD